MPKTLAIPETTLAMPMTLVISKTLAIPEILAIPKTILTIPKTSAIPETLATSIIERHQSKLLQ